MLALILASAAPCAVLANPTGGTVSAGSANISSSGSTLTVTQSTDKAIIDWRGFDIAAGETTNFKQPSSSSLTLNRVNSASASIINGNLKANGNLVIINQNGVLFGKNSVVNVNSLLATTADIDDAQFMAGKLTFNKPGNPNATIENQGLITAQEAGLVGLVAPNVLNSGVINAKLGRIQLASGDTATVDFYGDGLMEVQASPALQSQLVQNTGKLNAQGGTIAMTAAAAAETVNSLINVGGTLNANAVGTKNGKIYIYAEGSNAVQNNVVANEGVKTGSSTVVVTGKLTASSKSGVGGTINVLGDKVTVKSTAKIKANGSTGGGTIYIGGQEHGAGTTPTALTTTIEDGAFIGASAKQDGNGGTVIVWSDNLTSFNGSIVANGAGSGNGGFAEVSGHDLLRFNGTVNLLAPQGTTGTLLLDPENVTISSASDYDDNSCAAGGCTASGDNSIVNVTTLQNALASSNVIISTGTTGSQAGNITVANNVTWATGNLLTLSAAGNIIINSGVTISNTYTGAFGSSAIPVLLALRADSAGTDGGYGITNNGTINFSGSTGAVSLFYDSTGTYTAGTQTVNGSWVAPTNLTVSSQFTAYKLVNTLSDLAGISMSGTYALGKNIDGGGAAFNSNVSLGTFTGILDGQYCALTGGSYCGVTNITLTQSGAVAKSGLFQTIGTAGIVRNMTLGETLTLTSTAATTAGTLAGFVYGKIANVSSSGSVLFTYTGSTTQALTIGGLIGTLYSGTITGSSDSGNVTFVYQGTWPGTGTLYMGGLVGSDQSAATTSIYNSWASGSLLGEYASGYSSPISTSIGGLLGGSSASASPISTSYATGSVTDDLSGGSHYIGGLVGNNSATTASVINSYATGDVTYSGTTSADVGGLIGYNTASVTGTGGLFSYATGNVNVTSSAGGFAGGLIGYNAGAVSSVYTQTGAVSFTDTAAGTATPASYIGGLIADNNSGSLLNATTSENVTYTYQGTSTGASSVHLGGALGANYSSVTTSVSGVAASGTVLAQYASGYTGLVTAFLGGAFGQNGNGTVTSTTSNSASGAVEDYLTGATQDVGGLVGYNNSTSATSIVNSYATGLVTYSGASSSYTGGLIGSSVGGVSGTGGSSSYATGNVNVTSSGGGYVGGLIGYNTGAVSNVYTQTGAVTFTNTAAGTATPTSFVGGLIGFLTGANGTLTGASSSENVTYIYNGTSTGTSVTNVGGLIGRVSSSAANSVTSVSASGDVLAKYSATASGNVTGVNGGLIGYLTSATTVSSSSASGAVTDYLGGSSQYAAGFVGDTSGTLTNDSATGTITYNYTGTSAATFQSFVGGLVGYSNGTISGTGASYSYATGDVNFSSTSVFAKGYVGGLAGYSAGNVKQVYSQGGTVTYSGVTDAYAAGLIAFNSGSGTLGDASASSATTWTSENIFVTIAPVGTNVASVDIGGLVAINCSTAALTNVSSSGSATYTYEGTSTGTSNLYAGGLIGNNVSTATLALSSSWTSSNILAQYALGYTGSVTAYMGGVVGANGLSTNTAISGVYATGNVTDKLSGGSEWVGGLVGQNLSSAANSILNAYATGAVTYNGNTAADIGGLVGHDTSGGIVNSYSSGAVSSSTSSGNIGGLVGFSSDTITNSYWNEASSGQMASAGGIGLTTAQMQTQSSFSGWDFGSTWALLAGTSYPYLQWQGTPSLITGTSNLGSGQTVQAVKNGVVIGSVSTGADGSFYLMLSQGTIGAGSDLLLYNVGGGVNAANDVYIAGSNVAAGLTLTSGGLWVNSGNGALSNIATTMAAAKGGLTSADILFTTSGNTLMSAAATTLIENTSTGGITIDGVINTTGSLTVQSATGTDITLGAGASLNATASGTAITLASGGAFINNAGSSALTASNGRWLIYSANPASDTFGSLNSNNTAVWGTTYGGAITQTGNRYVFAYQPTLTFTSTSSSKSYGTDATAAVAAGYTISGLQSGVANAFLADSNATAFTGTASVTSLGSAASAQVSGGPYAIMVAQGTLASVAGYAFAYSSPGQLTVTPVALLITANNQSSTYGSGLPILTVSYSGLVNGDTSASLMTAPTVVSATAATANVGTYNGTITASGAVDSNYTISYAAGNLTISKAILTITAGNQTITYGSVVPVDTVTYSGFVNGDNISSLSSAARLTSAQSGIVNAGTYTGNYTVSGASGNYIFDYVNGNLTVLPRSLTVVTNSQTIYVGTPKLVFTGSNNLILQDASLVNWSYAPVGYSGSSGAYQIAASAADPQDRLANYAITYSEGTLIVDQIPSTVVMNSQTPAAVFINSNNNNSNNSSQSTSPVQGSKILAGGSANNHSMEPSAPFNLEISPALQRLIGVLNF